eukprot:3455392-Alexandrium_andersonii.AAC.1
MQSIAIGARKPCAMRAAGVRAQSPLARAPPPLRRGAPRPAPHDRFALSSCLDQQPRLPETAFARNGLLAASPVG